jgi:hypothetical protein
VNQARIPSEYWITCLVDNTGSDFIVVAVPREIAARRQDAGRMKLLLVIGLCLDDRREAEGKGERPQLDYDALAEAVRAVPGGQADILDRNLVDREAGWLVRLVRCLCGYNIALALFGYQRCYQYDAVFSHSELVALPFAFLIRPRSRRPRHAAYYLTGRRNALLYRLLGVHRGIDTIFTLSREQFETARSAEDSRKKTRTPRVVRLCRCQVLRYRDGTSCR